MQEQDPSQSQDSPTKNSLSSSADHQRPPCCDMPSPTPTEDTSGGVKIPRQMVELSRGGGGEGEGGGGDGVGVLSEEKLRVEVVVGDLSEVPGGSKQETKKRKPSDIMDPPSGAPKCELCLKQFGSWKAAFGHMRAHPDRQYRGFFKPPGFSSSSTSSAGPQAVQPQPQDLRVGVVAGGSGGDEGAGSSSAAAKEHGFDLNQTEEVEAATTAEKEEPKLQDFDLNALPPPDDDDQSSSQALAP